MNGRLLSPTGLNLRLGLYFSVLIAVLTALPLALPDSTRYLPVGGLDAVAVFESSVNTNSATSKTDAVEQFTGSTSRTLSLGGVMQAMLIVSMSLVGTILVMLPITWVYMVTRHEEGYRKSFVRGLIILPVCATTTVLLIQDSLALAFGLAALVAAVRFRVDLQEAIDGIYIFAAICVGLAAGVGYLGIATVMAAFFCFANSVLWQVNYGRNPVEDAKNEKKRAKLKKAAG